ncbi:hypothetical protein X738_21010 [Mesorhizobium sp. LNHC209A00]|nr:hypothetical protein X741_23885 [Mesorhizobium sp. LNHC229A00]ESY95914.1 hypothetical protein X738_21010 [Mesorhizobium sp. LNHC209A00]
MNQIGTTAIPLRWYQKTFTKSSAGAMVEFETGIWADLRDADKG